LDAPLPGSFDSQGISHAARHGPFASSVPPRLGQGLESPPSSLPNKAFLGSTLRGLGDTTLDGVLAGSSPPTFEEPMSFGKRPLHSERFSRPRPMMSASVGTRPSIHTSHRTLPILKRVKRKVLVKTFCHQVCMSFYPRRNCADLRNKLKMTSTPPSCPLAVAQYRTDRFPWTTG
jgi:hypothetical protein